MTDRDFYALFEPTTTQEWLERQEPLDGAAQTREEREMREDEW